MGAAEAEQGGGDGEEPVEVGVDGGKGHGWMYAGVAEVTLLTWHCALYVFDVC